MIEKSLLNLYGLTKKQCEWKYGQAWFLGEDDDDSNSDNDDDRIDGEDNDDCNDEDDDCRDDVDRVDQLKVIWHSNQLLTRSQTWPTSNKSQFMRRLLTG